jgi:hypothetical protein
MSTNIYNIYKLIKQRSSRNPNNLQYGEMTILARNLFEQNANKEELFDIANKLYEIEKKLNVSTLFSKRILDALNSGSYSLERPPQIKHRYEPQKSGWVYVASHDSKKNQLKIGATTNTPYRRMDLYFQKYGYWPSIEFDFFCNNPFSLEHDVKNQISDRLYCGLTHGDSNEWYEISLRDLKNEIISAYEKRSLKKS